MNQKTDPRPGDRSPIGGNQWSPPQSSYKRWKEAIFDIRVFLPTCLLLLPKRLSLSVPQAWKREEEGICPAGARSETWRVHPLGFCIHWRYGQGVYHGFQENCWHLIRQEDAILSSHPLDQVPTFLCPKPISNQGHSGIMTIETTNSHRFQSGFHRSQWFSS